ncbi:MAG: right-handed parallel beta-helix repeat-containing protein [Desulfobacterales bacterium]|nr:right-handed parallel beta-helix repeat-containing protein [Desulfobacterales bacterium]
MGKHVRCLMIVMVFVFSAVFTVEAWSEQAQSVVVGGNDPALDVRSVQDAVDKGGTVLLKGAFDFGDKGRVLIKNDVSIIGEPYDQGAPRTVIRGGFWTFHAPPPSREEPPKAPGPKIEIRDIHFDGAVWTPICIPYTRGVHISRNKITRVKPFALPYKWPGGETLPLLMGAYLGPRSVNRTKMLPGAATGLLVFENNDVDLKVEKPRATLGIGVYFCWTWGATIQVRGNRFSNASRNSIETLDNHLDEQGRGAIFIADNRVVTPDRGISFPTPRTPNGVIAGWFHDRTGAGDAARNPRIIIKNNFIEARGEKSIGVCLLSNNGVIEGNELVLSGGPGCSGVVLLGAEAVISGNTIKGSGRCALLATPIEGLEGSRNTFMGNDLAAFTPVNADVIFNGDHNILIGKKGKIVMNGKENQAIEY